MKKRFLSYVLILVLCMTAFMGCSAKQKCSICGETKSGKTETLLGEKVFICNDCLKEMKDLLK